MALAGKTKCRLLSGSAQNFRRLSKWKPIEGDAQLTQQLISQCLSTRPNTLM
jgi:hypothetical protein